MPRWLLTLVAVVALVGVAAAYQNLRAGVHVQAAPVSLGEVRQYVDERGKTRLPEVHQITMPYDGRIESIALQEGDAVTKGQPVAQIVQADLDLRLKRAQANVDRLQASIRENDDTALEKLSLQQSLSFVASMADTVKAALARTTSGKAKLDYAQRAFDRADQLFSRKAMSEEDLDRAKLNQVQSSVDYDQDKLVHSALVAMQAATNLMPTMVRQYIEHKALKHDVLAQELVDAEAALEQTRLDHQRGTMTSPVAGVVLERPVYNERALSTGTLLLKIGQLEALEVEAEILSQDVAQMKVGNPVEFYGPAIGPDGAKGEVSRIYPAGFTKISSLGVEQQRVLVILRFAEGELARLRKERPLGVDYRVSVRIITAVKTGATSVPRSALFRDHSGDWHVFVVRNRHAVLQPVEVGLVNDERAEITRGVSPDELVVLAPESSLADGTRVAAERIEPPSATPE